MNGEILELMRNIGTRDHPTPRKELSLRLGVSDRKMRRLVEQARLNGELILNAQDGSGYYISDDVLDLERQYRQDTARALSILSRRAAIRRRLRDAGKL